MTLKKAVRYGIPYELIKDLNYIELVYLVIDRDIELAEDYINKQQKENDRERGIHRRKATPEEMKNLFDGDD